MSWLPNPIACDICGAVKKDANHWYYAELKPDGDGTSFQIWSWDYPAEDRLREIIHLCGRVCAVKALSKWMDGHEGEGKPVKLEDLPLLPSDFEKVRGRVRRELASAALAETSTGSTEPAKD